MDGNDNLLNPFGMSIPLPVKERVEREEFLQMMRNMDKERELMMKERELLQREIELLKRERACENNTTEFEQSLTGTVIQTGRKVTA